MNENVSPLLPFISLVEQRISDLDLDLQRLFQGVKKKWRLVDMFSRCDTRWRTDNTKEKKTNKYLQTTTQIT